MFIKRFLPKTKLKSALYSRLFAKLQHSGVRSQKNIRRSFGQNWRIFRGLPPLKHKVSVPHTWSAKNPEDFRIHLLYDRAYLNSICAVECGVQDEKDSIEDGWIGRHFHARPGGLVVPGRGG